MPIREFVSLSVFLAAVLAVYIKEGMLISRLILHKIRRRPGPSGFLTKPAVAVHILAVVGILCFLYGLLVEPYWIEVKTVKIETPKLSRASIRVVQISDLHTEPKGVNEKKVVEIVNSLKPDIIVFTGDTVNSPKAIPVFKETMRDLQAGIGKFYVTGNYDFWFLRGLDLFGGTGFVPAERKNIRINKDGDVFYISGLDFGQNDWCYRTLKGIPAENYSIFLCHKPELIGEMKNVNVDLYLAGHTHGGQVALPFYGAIITLSKLGKRYEAGEYKVGKTVLYVNRGIGTEGKAGLRVRFLARPEITVFDITPEKER